MLEYKNYFRGRLANANTAHQALSNAKAPLMSGSSSSIDNDFLTDLADWIGFGTARREREFNAQQAQLTRDFNANEAQRAFDRQLEASNTAIQRQAADAKAAGINTAMLFANGNPGASVPGAGAASSSSATASGSSAGSFASVLNSASNLVNSFNKDKNKSNDITFKELKWVATTLAKL